MSCDVVPETLSTVNAYIDCIEEHGLPRGVPVRVLVALFCFVSIAAMNYAHVQWRSAFRARLLNDLKDKTHAHQVHAAIHTGVTVPAFLGFGAVLLLHGMALLFHGLKMKAHIDFFVGLLWAIHTVADVLPLFWVIIVAISAAQWATMPFHSDRKTGLEEPLNQ